MLKKHGVGVTGIDPTPALIDAASLRDLDGTYVEALGERLPFADASFDLVISYLTLIDMADIKAAIAEMERVLAPGGTLLIGSLNSFNTACVGDGWITNSSGERVHFAIDNYFQERAMWIDYRGIRVVNYHRPLSAYLRAFLEAGLRLTYFDEPLPSAEAPASRAASYRRVPWFLAMEWTKPG